MRPPNQGRDLFRSVLPQNPSPTTPETNAWINLILRLVLNSLSSQPIPTHQILFRRCSTATPPEITLTQEVKKRNKTQHNTTHTRRQERLRSQFMELKTTQSAAVSLRSGTATGFNTSGEWRQPRRVVGESVYQRRCWKGRQTKNLARRECRQMEVGVCACESARETPERPQDQREMKPARESEGR